MFKVSELLKAVSGEVVYGKAEGRVSGVSIDSRRIRKGNAFFAIKGDNFDGHDFIASAVKKGASCIVAQRNLKRYGGIPVIKVKDTALALGGIARFNRDRFAVPVIAVTGSNGKTTTKDMIADLLSKQLKVLKNEGTKNNHIGLPLTLLKLNSSYDAVVVEIGTNHFGEIAYLSGIASPNIGVITNIGPSHLKYLKNLSGVFREKYSLIGSLRRPAIAVLNSDDNYLSRAVSHDRGRVFAISYGVKNAADYRAISLRRGFLRQSFRLKPRFRFALNVPGYYNIYNALAAIAVARILGVSLRNISLALKGFNLPKSRLNILKENGVSFIDDTYNSNPLSLSQALNTLKAAKVPGRKIACLGDMLELGKDAEARHALAIKEAACFCDNVITVGKLSGAALKGARKMANVISCKDSFEARFILKGLKLTREDLVLVKGSRAMKMEEVFKK